MNSKFYKSEGKEFIEDLVVEVQQGNLEAFGKLYDVFIKRIFRFIYFRIGNYEDAQDITSETWKTIWANLYKYKKGNFQGYIFRIAYTTLISFVRKRKKTSSLEEIRSIPAKEISIEKKFEQKERIEKFYKALKKLPQGYAEIITLRLIEGFSIKETAAILKKSSIVVRVTQHRAQKKLRKMLKDI